jgi:hypothetical protein
VPTEYTDSHLPHSERPSEGDSATTSPSPAHAPVIRSLGHLAKGLSALFWGLPIALVVCVQCAKGDWFRPLGIVPPLVATGLLFYALSLLGNFQRQERIWMSTLERAKIIALINVGISPFLYWWSRIPSNSFFSLIMDCTLVAGLLFLLLLNPVLLRLTAMLPDETLRMETRLFTSMNRTILLIVLSLLVAYLAMVRIEPGSPEKLLGWMLKVLPLPHQAQMVFYFLDRAGLWLMLFPILFPIAMTMALIWKIKEVILVSIFGNEH